MSFDLSTAKWVAWGAKNPYNTYGHVQQAFVRALKYLGKSAQWLDVGDDISQVDFNNTVFLGLNATIAGMPQRKDCYYIIHNGIDPASKPYFDGLNFIHFGVHISTNDYWNVAEIGPEVFFSPMCRSLSFRWGTDLLPHEIEANKPERVFNSDSRVINYVGTIDNSNRDLINNFRRAAAESGISFEHFGGIGDRGRPVVSVEDNVRLIRESYMAPTIQRQSQVTTGYIPCRLFKNLSYGQLGVTNSNFANDLFGGKLVFNSDTHRLFHDARERLQSMQLSELHALMDEVAKKHTYLNKIEAIEYAIKVSEGGM